MRQGSDQHIKTPLTFLLLNMVLICFGNFYFIGTMMFWYILQDTDIDFNCFALSGQTICNCILISFNKWYIPLILCYDKHMTLLSVRVQIYFFLCFVAYGLIPALYFDYYSLLETVILFNEHIIIICRTLNIVERVNFIERKLIETDCPFIICLNVALTARFEISITMS